MNTITLHIQKWLPVRSFIFPRFELRGRTLAVIGFMALSFLFLAYIIQVNRLTSQYYQASVYEATTASLAKENKMLQVSFAENSFLNHVLAKAQMLDLQMSPSVQYIQVLDNSFALARP